MKICQTEHEGLYNVNDSGSCERSWLLLSGKFIIVCILGKGRAIKREGERGRNIQCLVSMLSATQTTLGKVLLHEWGGGVSVVEPLFVQWHLYEVKCVRCAKTIFTSKRWICYTAIYTPGGQTQKWWRWNIGASSAEVKPLVLLTCHIMSSPTTGVDVSITTSTPRPPHTWHVISLYPIFNNESDSWCHVKIHWLTGSVEAKAEQKQWVLLEACPKSGLRAKMWHFNRFYLASEF